MLAVNWSRISASTPPTWSGLTAKTSTAANFATSGLQVVVLAPISLAKAARAASLGSLAMTAGGNQTRPNKTLGQRRSHFARAQKTDGELCRTCPGFNTSANQPEAQTLERNQRWVCWRPNPQARPPALRPRSAFQPLEQVHALDGADALFCKAAMARSGSSNRNASTPLPSLLSVKPYIYSKFTPRLLQRH